MKDRYKRITSLPLASFLLVHKQEVSGINPTGDGDQMEFAFVISSDIEELINAYRFGPIGDPRLKVDVKLYEQARNELLSALKDYK